MLCGDIMANELKPSVFNVYDLGGVPNVCEQILREVLRLPLTSMAHVTMNKRNASLLHNHKIMEESYFILEGEGILHKGDEAIEVTKGAFLSISKGVFHKLRNIGAGDLEHLIFAYPPFNPADVFLITDDKIYPEPRKYLFSKKSFSARD